MAAGNTRYDQAIALQAKADAEKELEDEKARSKPKPNPTVYDPEFPEDFRQRNIDFLTRALNVEIELGHVTEEEIDYTLLTIETIRNMTAKQLLGHEPAYITFPQWFIDKYNSV